MQIRVAAGDIGWPLAISIRQQREMLLWSLFLAHSTRVQLFLLNHRLQSGVSRQSNAGDGAYGTDGPKQKLSPRKVGSPDGSRTVFAACKGRWVIHTRRVAKSAPK